MKKGLTQTLLTVALALLGYQALALAPVITDIPSPVIGNAEATQGNKYVWPDAIALDNFVNDDNTSKTDIKWYYRVERDGGPTSANPQHYMLNGVRTLTAAESAATDASTLPEAARIDNQTLQSELNPDTNNRTVTIRNIWLSPLDGSAEHSLTVTEPTDSEVITLYASDGTTYSTKEVMFWSQKDVNDHTYATATPTPFYHCSWTNSSEGWMYTSTMGATSATSGNTAICFNVTTPGGAFDEWKSPMGAFTVEQNAVYKIRGNLNGSWSTAGHTPFWDIYLNNYDGTNGLNLFGADLFILDNAASGSADSVYSSTNGQDFQLWFAPTCVDTDQWKNNYTANATGNNMKVYLGFRVLDVRADLGSATTAGTLCLTDLDITKYPLSAMTTVGNPVYSLNNLAPNTGANGNIKVDKLAGLDTDTTVNFSGGAMTVTPGTSGSGASGLSLVNILPATDTNYHLGTSDIGDDFPVAWDSNTLYMVTWNLMAPSSTAEANPFNGFYIGVDTPSNEVLMETFVTNFGTNKFAMPKYNGGTAQTYKAFWYSHTASTASTPFYNHFRPRLTPFNKGSLMNGGTNNGGLKITGCSVQKVTFQ